MVFGQCINGQGIDQDKHRKVTDSCCVHDGCAWGRPGDVARVSPRDKAHTSDTPYPAANGLCDGALKAHHPPIRAIRRRGASLGSTGTSYGVRFPSQAEDRGGAGGPSRVPKACFRGFLGADTPVPVSRPMVRDDGVRGLGRRWWWWRSHSGHCWRVPRQTEGCLAASTPTPMPPGNPQQVEADMAAAARRGSNKPRGIPGCHVGSPQAPPLPPSFFACNSFEVSSPLRLKKRTLSGTSILERPCSK